MIVRGKMESMARRRFSRLAQPLTARFSRVFAAGRRCGSLVSSDRESGFRPVRIVFYLKSPRIACHTESSYSRLPL